MFFSNELHSVFSHRIKRMQDVHFGRLMSTPTPHFESPRLPFFVVY